MVEVSYILDFKTALFLNSFGAEIGFEIAAPQAAHAEGSKAIADRAKHGFGHISPIPIGVAQPEAQLPLVGHELAHLIPHGVDAHIADDSTGGLFHDAKGEIVDQNAPEDCSRLVHGLMGSPSAGRSHMGIGGQGKTGLRVVHRPWAKSQALGLIGIFHMRLLFEKNNVFAIIRLQSEESKCCIERKMCYNALWICVKAQLPNHRQRRQNHNRLFHPRRMCGQFPLDPYQHRADPAGIPFIKPGKRKIAAFAAIFLLYAQAPETLVGKGRTLVLDVLSFAVEGFVVSHLYLF